MKSPRTTDSLGPLVPSDRGGSNRVALSVGEVAEMLGVSSRHVWKLTAMGKLPQPIRLGRSARWLRDDLLAALRRLA